MQRTRRTRGSRGSVSLIPIETLAALAAILSRSRQREAGRQRGGTFSLRYLIGKEHARRSEGDQRFP